MSLPDPVTQHIAIQLETDVGGGVIDVHHPYLERTYLPLIGPSATVCLRRLGELVSAQAAALVDLSELAVELGLPRRLARSAPMIRTLNRLIGFRLARWEACRLFVPAALPLLSRGTLERLPASAKAYHRLVVRALMAPGGDGDHMADLGSGPLLGVRSGAARSSGVGNHRATR